MHCPACDRTLLRLKAGFVTVDVCHGCGGIWFDHRELEQVSTGHPDDEAPVVDFDFDPETRLDEFCARHCPRCKIAALAKKLYSLGSGVIMDCCPQCQGVWLDHGELAKIREALHPRPRKRRYVERQVPAQTVAVGLDVIQQVQILRLGQQPRA